MRSSARSRQHAAALFVEDFAAAWASRDPDRLIALLHPDVRLHQPLIGPISGHPEARESLDRVAKAVPDLAIEILAWAGRGSTVFIEFEFRGSDGTRLPAVDCFELVGDRASLRLTYVDLAAVTRQLLLDPRRIPRLLSTGAGLRGVGNVDLPPTSAQGTTRRFAESVARSRVPGVAPSRVLTVSPLTGGQPDRRYVSSPWSLLPTRPG